MKKAIFTLLLATASITCMAQNKPDTATIIRPGYTLTAYNLKWVVKRDTVVKGVKRWFAVNDAGGSAWLLEKYILNGGYAKNNK